MTILQGKVTGVFDNEKYAVVTLDAKDGKRISLTKNEYSDFMALKGSNITLTVDEREFQGKTYYNSKLANITSSEKSNVKGGGNNTSMGVTGNDKDHLIVRQNSLAHATAIAIHNAGKNPVDLDTVLSIASQIEAAVFSKDFARQSELTATMEEPALMQSVLQRMKRSGTLVLIDGDVVAYQVCSNAGLNTSLPLLKSAVTRTITGYIEFLNGHFKDVRRIEVHLTGSTNYRNAVSTSVVYKGNRLGKEKPPGFYEIREYITEKYAAELSVDEEADDAISIRACAHGDPTKVVVVSPDKDMHIIPAFVWDGNPEHPMQLGSGIGYLQWQRRRNYSQVVGCGLKFFYWQLIMGDTADNIKRPWKYKRGEIFEHYENM